MVFVSERGYMGFAVQYIISTTYACGFQKANRN